MKNDINTIKLLEKYSGQNTEALNILIKHSKKVTDKALKIAKKVKKMKPDIQFIKEAAMLHDIGIFQTDAPDIKCFGKEPYIKHGIIGKEILKKEGLYRHALVCERHTGTGITKKEIVTRNLPLPHHDMIPQSLEEKIIAYADKFYTKLDNNKLKSKKEILEHVGQFGKNNINIFLEWEKTFDR